MAGASDELEVTAGATDDEEASADDDAGAAEDDEDAFIAGASDDEEGTALDEAGASDELDTTLDEAVFTGVVAGLRLKIQIRPMITITATMMIIQVLRFMGECPWV